MIKTDKHTIIGGITMMRTELTVDQMELVVAGTELGNDPSPAEKNAGRNIMANWCLDLARWWNRTFNN